MGAKIRRDQLIEVFVIYAEDYGFLFLMELEWKFPLVCSCQTDTYFYHSTFILTCSVCLQECILS